MAKISKTDLNELIEGILNEQIAQASAVNVQKICIEIMALAAKSLFDKLTANGVGRGTAKIAAELAFDERLAFEVAKKVESELKKG